MIRPDGIVIRNGSQRFNRAVFGHYSPRPFNWDNHRFKVLAHEVLYEYRWNGTESYAREFFPFLREFAACQKRLFDSDNDCLYDARINYWASDAIYYSGGGTLIGSAYNYALNRGLADMARIIGEDPAPFDREADGIFRAVHEKLYMPERGYFAGADFHGQSLCIPLDESRPLARLKLESRINDAVLCLMAITKII